MVLSTVEDGANSKSYFNTISENKLIEIHLNRAVDFEAGHSSYALYIVSI